VPPNEAPSPAVAAPSAAMAVPSPATMAPSAGSAGSKCCGHGTKRCDDKTECCDGRSECCGRGTECCCSGTECCCRGRPTKIAAKIRGYRGARAHRGIPGPVRYWMFAQPHVGSSHPPPPSPSGPRSSSLPLDRRSPDRARRRRHCPRRGAIRYGITAMLRCEGYGAVCHTRCVCAWKSSGFAAKTFGTKR
jgi:hypothetical protein